MKFKFDSNQQYQTDAVNSLVSLFDGQPIDSDEFKSSIKIPGELLHDDIIRNILVIDKETIKRNIIKIQDANDLDNGFTAEQSGLDFSVEMETGTGKTYVYLKTIFELNKKYGFKKFIIVVPSVAIREGVLKNLEITEEHFKSIFNVNYNYFTHYFNSIVRYSLFMTYKSGIITRSCFNEGLKKQQLVVLRLWFRISYEN